MNSLTRFVFQSKRLNSLLLRNISYYEKIDLDSRAGTFYAKDISIEENRQKTPKPKVWEPSKLLFGKVPTDYMMTVDWDNKQGW